MSTEIAIITNALADTRIMQQSETTVKQSLVVIVQRMFALAGQTSNMNDVLVIVKEINNDLQTRYKLLTITEVNIALENGIKGDYGEYFGINVVTLNKWLRAYYASDERKQAMKQKLNSTLALPEQATLTESEKQKLLENAVTAAYLKFKNNGYVLDLGNVVYNYLAEKGEIKFTKEEKDEILEIAKKELIAETKSKATNVINMRILLSALGVNSVVNRAKRIALNRFFNEKL